MMLSLFILFIFLMVLIWIYLIRYRAVTPISFFIILSLCYVSSTPIMLLLEEKQLSMIYDYYGLFSMADIMGAVFFYLIVMMFVVKVDLNLIRKLLVLSELSRDNEYGSIRLDYYLAVLVFGFALIVFGIYSYGVNDFYGGYKGAGVINIGVGLGWRSIALGDLLLFFSASALLKVLKKGQLYWLVLCIVLVASLMQLLGGARLLVFSGALGVFFFQNNFLVRIDSATYRIMFLFIALFVLFGAMRGGSGYNLDSLLAAVSEFGFVGFGYYNILEVRNPYDFHIFSFMYDVIVYSLLPFFDKYSLILRSSYVGDLFLNAKYLSPVGGTFFLTDLYLYLGLFSIFIPAFIFYSLSRLYLYYFSLRPSPYRLLLGAILALLSGNFMIELMRDSVLWASSFVVKALTVYWVTRLVYGIGSSSKWLSAEVNGKAWLKR